MSTTQSVQELNQQVADEVNAEALRDPKSPYFGKFVGIVDGKVVTVANTLDEMADHFRQLGADPAHCFGIEAGIDYSIPQEIWKIR